MDLQPQYFLSLPFDESANFEGLQVLRLDDDTLQLLRVFVSQRSLQSGLFLRRNVVNTLFPDEESRTSKRRVVEEVRR